MSVLLVGARGALGRALIARLVEEDDDVRVVENDKEVADEWRRLGAHVAQGDPADADLIERAAQHCRTVVVLQDPVVGMDEVLDPVIEGARFAGVERVVLCGGDLNEADVAKLRSGGSDYVVMTARGKRGLFRRSALSPEKVAEAIDAADDISGNPRLELDLDRRDAWTELGLEAPAS